MGQLLWAFQVSLLLIVIGWITVSVIREVSHYGKSLKQKELTAKKALAKARNMAIIEGTKKEAEGTDVNPK